MASKTGSKGHNATKQFRSPKTVIGRFVARRTIRSALLWGVVFGGYVASKAIGFVDVYPTAAARAKIAQTFSNNVGIELLLGKAPHSSATAAYVAWNTGGIMVTIGAIWILLLTTKYLRGEEDAGRTEILLSGQTTARRALVNATAGILASLSAFFIVLSLLLTLVGKSHGVDYGTSAALYFALSVVAGILVFMSLAALTSQLMPTRSRASSLAATIFGVFYILKAIADVTSASWLLNLDPLGWVEKLQPLASTKPIWFLPIGALILILGALSLFFAGRRDLDSSIIADRPTAKVHDRLLNSPLGAAFRLRRANMIGWSTAILLTAILYGFIAKATAQAFSQSSHGSSRVLSRLAHQSHVAGAVAFLGVVFLIQMVLIMSYASSMISNLRDDEAEGYVDNFLVGPISRMRWLGGRLLLTLMAIVIGGILTTVGAWIGVASQHLGLSFHSLIIAGLNILVPVAFTAAAGVFAFGIYPRLTSFVAYGVLAWAFLIEMLSSGIHLNHWVVDTSILSHIVLAPAANPKWSTNLVIIIISIALCLIGMVAFNRRDLQNE